MNGVPAMFNPWDNVWPYTRTARLVLVFGWALLMVASIGFSVWLLTEESGAHQAWTLRSLAWNITLALLIGPSLVSYGVGARSATDLEARRLRARRWLESSKSARLFLKPASSSPADVATADLTPLRPDAWVVLDLAAACLAAACVGFGGAMTFFIVHSASENLMILGPRWEAVLSVAMYGSVMAAIINKGSRVALHVFRWTEEQTRIEAVAKANFERARLSALQSHTAPQFLAKTLATIEALAESDPARAERIVETLSVFLRHSLQNASRHTVPLDDELQFVHEYVVVELERLGEKLHVDFAVERGDGQVEVPTGCLQSVVQHVLTQVAKSDQSSSRITIGCSIRGLLRFWVQDDRSVVGAAMDEAQDLGNVRDQLELAYGMRAAVTVHVDPGRNRVNVAIPVLS
jgi:hypothetical protein